MSKSKRLLLIGGGGHCISVIDSITKEDTYDDIAIIDKTIIQGSRVLGIPCIGDDERLYDLASKYEYAFVTIGSTGDSAARIRLQKHLISLGYKIPNILDPTSVIGSEVQLGCGIFIGKNAVVNACSVIENGVIVNTSCVVEHECFIGQFSHIASGAVLCGNVKIGTATHVGANSTIKQGVNIGNNVLIGMGSNVLKDVKSNVMIYGNPAEISAVRSELI